MTKDKISDYSQSPASNDDLGEGGTAVDCYIDRGLKTVMAHLAQVNGGTESLDDTLTLADSDDRSKRFGFDGSDVTPSSKVVLKIPDSSGTIATRETISHDLDNKIINGDFDIWQRGISGFTINNQHNADRYMAWGNSGDICDISRQEFTPDQTEVPGNPKYFLRASLQAGTSGGVNRFWQKIEGVRTLAGRKVTLTYYIRSTIAGALASPYVIQNFGSGGSATAIIGIGAVNVSTAWQKVQFVFTLPSLTGKILGVVGTDYLGVALELPVNQTTNFDLAHMSLVEGDATAVNDPFPPRHVGQELSLCQRYYFENFLPMRGVAGGTSVWRLGASLPVQMRSSPSVTVSGSLFDGAISTLLTSITSNYSTPSAIEIDAVCAAPLTTGRIAVLYYPSTLTADAEL